MKHRTSAGLLMFRRGAARRTGAPAGGSGRASGDLHVFLIHPGGPFFTGKDDGAWSIPKGLVDEADAGELGEVDLLSAARREFEEETGLAPPDPREAEYIPLGTVKQKSGKVVHGWAFEGEWPEGRPFVSNTFRLEWPPGSGRVQEFPEADRGSFFSLEEARRKMIAAQTVFLERLRKKLS